MAESSSVSPSQANLRQAMSEYLKSLKPEQRRQHEQHVRRYVEFMGEDFQVSQLTGSRVESYAEAQIRPTDPNAQDRVVALKAWFQYLKKKDYVAENHGIHIRVRKTAGRTPGRSTSTRLHEPLEMTAEGVEALQTELAEIQATMPGMERAVATAREDGDLRENAPYHAAREALAFKTNRKQQIESALKRAVVVERASGADDRSTVGSVVTVTRMDKGETIVYKLVGAREANAADKKISVESPVGAKLLGRRPGDQVEVNVPSGVIQYRVDAVSHG